MHWKRRENQLFADDKLRAEYSGDNAVRRSMQVAHMQKRNGKKGIMTEGEIYAGACENKIINVAVPSS